MWYKFGEILDEYTFLPYLKHLHLYYFKLYFNLFYLPSLALNA